MSQRQLNRELTNLYEALEETLPRNNNRVIRVADRSRLTVSDILSKYANADGKIPKGKMSAVIKEVESVEGEIYRDIRVELQAVLQGYADSTAVGIAEAILLTLGVASLIEFTKLSGSIATEGVDLASTMFNVLTGSTYKGFADSTRESAFNRKGTEDDKRLNDRLKGISKALRDEITDTLRKSIRNGEVTTEITRKVGRKFKDLSWRLKTIVETEALFVMRHGISKFAELSGVAKGLKIVDYPHGDPKAHRRHECYIYNNRDEHGLGEGVYPVGTKKIKNPHPRCRSTLHIILKDSLKGG